jgi:hypothetical protein
MRMEDGMNTVHGMILGLAIAIGGLACSAQDAKIPFRQIAQNAQLSATATVPGNETGVSHSYEMPRGSLSTSGFVFVPPASKKPRTLSTGFFLINGLHLGMAALDIGMTQHCIADHHCREGNPMMPSSLSGQLGVDFALVGWGGFVSYRMKKQENKAWWFSPVVGIAAHAAGVATGFAHR